MYKSAFLVNLTRFSSRASMIHLYLVHGRIKATLDDIQRSLQGIWKEDYLFELQQFFDMYHMCQSQILGCDQRIEALVKSKATEAHNKVALPERKMAPNKNNLHFDAGRILKELTGTDFTAIFGVSDSVAIAILSEVGFDMSKWPTSRHFYLMTKPSV